MSVRAASCAVALALGTLLASPLEAKCRLALALALDVSGSVDAREYTLQKDGLAAALLRPEVQAALLALPDTPLRLMAYEWSDTNHQRILAPWREISSPAALGAFAAELKSAVRQPAPPATALGAAMSFGLAALNSQQDCWAHTLDISGDGKANTGPLPQSVKPAAEARGVTINALVIGADNPETGDIRYFEIGELIAYFTANVITGPAAFTEAALGFGNYEEAMARKLLREVAPGFVSDAPSTGQGAPLPARPARLPLPQ